jgi:hypothetical protein
MSEDVVPESVLMSLTWWPFYAHTEVRLANLSAESRGARVHVPHEDSTRALLCIPDTLKKRCTHPNRSLAGICLHDFGLVLHLAQVGHATVQAHPAKSRLSRHTPLGPD